jgi:hypothetical protein
LAEGAPRTGHRSLRLGLYAPEQGELNHHLLPYSFQPRHVAFPGRLEGLCLSARSACRIERYQKLMNDPAFAEYEEAVEEW